ncbi:helix-turn-helix domain-containing protein [Streptomyces sp. 5-10]|uniref:helix-turn-helix domain-containing protein n=1 Tax=Streptomyces sp. 5-10 TaxID=878925 RepID=UPI00168AC091|nr:helix-turn-helix domain-containing protein [Streptomyces sp. 5-10]MBD3004879.1 hypothetical protein [Streptomyces sp. 5-10]
MSASIKRGLMGADVFGKQYTRVANEAARDRRLSYRASGILLELASHAEGFTTSVAALASRAQEGRKAIDVALKELEQHGYLTRKQVQDPVTKRFGGTVYTVTDMPQGSRLWEAYRTLMGDTENPRSEPLTPEGDTGETAGGSRYTLFRDAAQRDAVERDAEKATHKKTTSGEDEGLVEEQPISLSSPLPLPGAGPAGAGERDAASPHSQPVTEAGGQGAGMAASGVEGNPMVPPEGPLWSGEEGAFAGSSVPAGGGCSPSLPDSPSSGSRKNRSGKRHKPADLLPPGAPQGASRGPGRAKGRREPSRAAVRALRALDKRIEEPLAVQLAGCVDPRWSEQDLLKHLRACYSPKEVRSPKALLEKILRGLPDPVMSDPVEPKGRVRLGRGDSRHKYCPVCQGTQYEEDPNGKLTGFWCENLGHYGEKWLDPMRYWNDFRPTLGQDRLVRR